MNNIIEEMISKVNKEELYAIIATLSHGDLSADELDMDKHIRTWAENKAHIYELFGRKLTIEVNDLVEMPECALYKKTNELISSIEKQKEFYLAAGFLSSLNQSEVMKNLLNKDIQFFDTTFKAKTKVAKCFNSLVKKEHLDKIKTLYSMYLQSAKSKGTGVISIDPKDFLTMSENNSDWCSCHNLNGDYRAGTISYMMDISSTISYIKSVSAPEVILPNYSDDTTYSYANKSWRQIILIEKNNKYALQMRQYPNDSVINSSTIGKMLCQYLKDNNNNEDYKIEPVSVNGSLKSIVVNRGDTSLFYNDVTCESFSDASLICLENNTLNKIRDLININMYKPLEVGAPKVTCLMKNCDQVIQTGSALFCEDCDRFYDSDYDD